MTSSVFSVCAAVYATLAVLIAVQARQSANILLAVCCGLTAVWAAFGVFSEQPRVLGVAGLLDLIRCLVWYVYLLYLYTRSGVGTKWQIRSFGGVALAAFSAGLATTLMPDDSMSYSLLSMPISIRLLVGIFELLLIENLYLNLPPSARWHITVPCILLGGLACIDILVSADAALFRRPSVSLTNGRTIAMIVVAPLLVLAALRGQRWSEPVRLSRSAVFHSATLVLSGSVLLALALTGEVLRHVDGTWGQAAEIGLMFGGVIFLLLVLSSRSARTLIDQLIVQHFFADRFDYRMQWLSCIGTLSGQGDNEPSNLNLRVIRAIADVVNSPNGALFLKHEGSGSMVCTSSWNMPTNPNLVLPARSLFATSDEQSVVVIGEAGDGLDQISTELGPIWLMVPLLHSMEIIGVVAVGPARTAFRLDQEVFDLLGILGKEVGTYLAEQRAIEVVTQTRSLHEYGTRFAFVAHDIKNVSSQLSLLLSNAEHHLANPDFQLDMLRTVRSSTEKIDRLLRRLDEPAADGAVAAFTPIARLKDFLAGYPRGSKVQLTSNLKETNPAVAISPSALDTVMTHLLNNAVEAAPTLPVHVNIDRACDRIMIDITDRGEGMSAIFVADELFSPFKTRKRGGSGIGAFQARELIKEAGGDLLVISEPHAGTTMRILLPRAGCDDVAELGRPLLSVGGEFHDD